MVNFGLYDNVNFEGIYTGTIQLADNIFRNNYNSLMLQEFLTGRFLTTY